MTNLLRVFAFLVTASASIGGATLRAEEPPLPPYLADRGEGIPTSLFGTYIGKKDFIVYAFYEYTKTTAFEYKPSELGYVGDSDFLGKTVEQEYLVYLAYGFTERLAVELEMAVYAKESFDKAGEDFSSVPAHLEESGLGAMPVSLAASPLISGT